MARGINRYKEFQSQINAYLTKTNRTKNDLADTLRMSRSTFYRKYNAPETFTYEEIVLIIKMMDIEDNIKLKLIN